MSQSDLCVFPPRCSVRIFPTMVCADPSLQVVQDMLFQTRAVSSKRRYPNTYISFTNTSNFARERIGKIAYLGYVGEDIVLVGFLYVERLDNTILGTRTLIAKCGFWIGFLYTFWGASLDMVAKVFCSSLHIHMFIHVHIVLRWQLSISRGRTWLQRCYVPRNIQVYIELLRGQPCGIVGYVTSL